VSVNGTFGRPRRIGVLLVYTENATSRYLVSRSLTQDTRPQPPSFIGHIVLLPSATPHRPLRLVTDVDLLLAATISSVRMNRPAVVFEPSASLAACVRCQEAYAQARKVIEDAVGIAKWMEWVAR
jgi:hypothetical protein